MFGGRKHPRLGQWNGRRRSSRSDEPMLPRLWQRPVLFRLGIVWLTAWLVPGFDASGFWQIAKAAIVIWFTNMVLSGFWPDRRRGGAFVVTGYREY